MSTRRPRGRPVERRTGRRLGRRRGRLLGGARRPVRPDAGRLSGVLSGRCGIDRTDRVLDIGCGTGQSTRAAARLAEAGHALGVDLSASMIDVARRRAARERGCATPGSSGPTRRYTRSRPAVSTEPSAVPGPCSSATRRPRSPTSAGALRPGGRLTLLTWQPANRNEWFGPCWTASPWGAPAAPTARGAKPVRPCRSGVDGGAARRHGIRGHRHRSGRGIGGPRQRRRRGLRSLVDLAGLDDGRPRRQRPTSSARRPPRRPCLPRDGRRRCPRVGGVADHGVGDGDSRSARYLRPVG